MNWGYYLHVLKQCIFATLILIAIYIGFVGFFVVAPQSWVEALTDNGAPTQVDMSPDQYCNGC